MKDRKYLAIGLIMILMLSLGCVDQQDQPNEQKAKTSSIKETAPAPIDTPVQIPRVTDDRLIIIKHSSKTTSNIGQYSEASPGKIFLIVTMTIENKGYQSLNTNPNYFSVIIDNIKYSYVSETYSLSDKLDTIDILDGGTITGSIAFLIPADANKYKLVYDQSFRNYNIEYIPSNPVP